MTPAASRARFQAAALDRAYRLRGLPVVYTDRAGKAYQLLGRYSAIGNKERLQDGGFLQEHEFVCRLRRSEMPDKPQEEGALAVGGITFRVAEVVDHHTSLEWKLGLRSNV